MDNLKSGNTLQGGKYKIIRFISSGGFGCTYEAEHTLLHKRVAIKEFFVEDFCNRDSNTMNVSVATESKRRLVDKLKRKFCDEAVAISKFSHPNIVKVHDVFEEHNTYYYVMDYLKGGSLKDVVKQKGRISESEATAYILQLCDALRYVHSRNCLHLDIKPGNIMLDGEGRVVLIDFGASKQYDEVSGENTSSLLGNTPRYAPIEQMENDVHSFTPATDIYSVGATFFNLLTGTTPPEPTKILEKGFPTNDLKSARINTTLISVIEKSMSVIKKDRYQNIDDIASAISEQSFAVEGVTLISDEKSEVDNHFLCDKKICKDEDHEKFSKSHLLITLMLMILVVVLFLKYNIGQVVDNQMVQELVATDSDNIEEPKSVISVGVKSKPEETFRVVDQMPSYSGGQAALFKYLSANIEYPSIAEENGVQGKVYVEFCVEKDGCVREVKLLKSLEPSCDAEAVRVVKSMPKWIPGKHNGEIVRVWYTLPIVFKLD